MGKKEFKRHATKFLLQFTFKVKKINTDSKVKDHFGQYSLCQTFTEFWNSLPCYLERKVIKAHEREVAS